MAVAPPELAVRRAVDVAMPGIDVADRLGAVGAGERDLDVRHVVARRRECARETDCDRGRDRCRPVDSLCLRAVVDRRVVGEERGDRLGLVAVEVEAVGVDHVHDRLAVGELADCRLEVGHAQASIARSSVRASCPCRRRMSATASSAKRSPSCIPSRYGAVPLASLKAISSARRDSSARRPSSIVSPGSTTFPPWALSSELPGGRVSSRPAGTR